MKKNTLISFVKCCTLVFSFTFLILSFTACSSVKDRTSEHPTNENSADGQDIEVTGSTLNSENETTNPSGEIDNDNGNQTDNKTDESNKPQTIDYTTTFKNENNVTFHISLANIEYPSNNMPLVEAEPYSFSPDDAKRIANILFEDSTFYEDSEPLTKEKIEQYISMYEASITEDALHKEFGDDKESAETALQGRQALLDYFRELYNTASEEPTRLQCQWIFHPSSFYDFGPSGTIDEKNRSMEIRAIVECPDGRKYSYQVLNNDDDDISEHRINVYLDSPLEAIALREPSLTDIENIKSKAESLLSETGLGEFKVEKTCTVQYSDDDVQGYAVSVSAVQLFNGWPVLHQTKVLRPRRSITQDKLHSTFRRMEHS